MKLKAKNKELEQRLEMANKELLDLQALNQSIIAINEEFGRENDDLYKKVGQYETLQKPRSMQKYHTHKNTTVVPILKIQKMKPHHERKSYLGLTLILLARKTMMVLKKMKQVLGSVT